jgi:DNA polymerase kappa
MDAFFANVELLYNPDLDGKPFGVRDFVLHEVHLAPTITQVGFGILTTASYEARKYGVRSGMPGIIH